MKRFSACKAMKFLKEICGVSDYLDPALFSSSFSDKESSEVYLENSRKRLAIFSSLIKNYVSKTAMFPFECYLYGDLPSFPTNCLAIKNGRCDKEIWICGHHDYSAAEGAEDNAAALVIMIELARMFKDEKLNYTLCFASFDLEEKGLLGSINLSSDFERNKRLPKIDYLINLDCVSSGKDILIPRNVQDVYSDAELVALIDYCAKELGYKFIIQPDCAWSADHMPFAYKGVKTVQLSSWTNGSNICHSDKDTIKNVRIENLKMVGEVLIRVIKELDA